MKRMLSLLLTLVLAVGMIAPVQAKFSWRLTNGTLVFSGDGEIPYSNSWKQYQFARATKVEVQEGITSVGDSAFASMGNLLEVKLPSTVTKIDRNAFHGCAQVPNFDLPDGLTYLGEYAFKGCNAIKSITIPKGVTAIRRGTFSDCGALERVEFQGNVTSLNAEVFRNCIKLAAFAVPEGVKRIYFETFAYCSGLVQIYLPVSVETIDETAFDFCTGLTDVYYGGTRAQWAKMNIQDELLKSGDVTIHYNADADDLDYEQAAAESKGVRFDDVPLNYWGYDAVMAIAAHGLVTGTRQPDASGVGSFTPAGDVTLGQFLVVVTRLVCPELRKDTPGHWALGSYNAAVEAGIIDPKQFSGSDGALDAPLKRQHMAYILVRAAQLQGETFEIHPDAQASIKDYGMIADNRKQDVLKCYSNGIISGFTDGSFGPGSTMTRGQMAVVVCRLAGWQDRAKVKF